MGRGPTPSYYRVLNEDYVDGTLTCLKPSTIKMIINSEFPNVLNIEPTNRCNLKCVYCPREKARKGVGLMDFRLYTRLIDEAVDYGQLTMLHFHKDGESFLHPRFLDMTRYAKNKGVAKTIHLNSNAVCWTDSVIDGILDSGLDDITVSLDAARQTTYRKHKGADCLDKVERQVRNFFEKRAQRGLRRPFVRVKMMEFDQIPPDEIEEFYTKWQDVADLVQITGIHSWSGAIEEVQVTDEMSAVRYPCAIMWYSLAVNWNGEVNVCSVDWDTEIKVGDANLQRLHEIWNSVEIKDARKAHIQGNYHAYRVCQDCAVWVSVGDLGEWLASQKQYYSQADCQQSGTEAAQPK